MGIPSHPLLPLQFNPKMSAQARPCSFLDTTLNNFILLNDQGDALDGFYITFDSIPSQSDDVGVAQYVDARGTTDEIRFRFSSDKSNMICWHVKSPNHTFDIRPIMDGDELVGLEVKFDADNIAFFALELDNYDLDEDMSPEPAVACLTTITF